MSLRFVTGRNWRSRLFRLCHRNVVQLENGESTKAGARNNALPNTRYVVAKMPQKPIHTPTNNAHTNLLAKWNCNGVPPTRTATAPKSNFGDTTVTNSLAGHTQGNYDGDILVSWWLDSYNSLSTGVILNLYFPFGRRSDTLRTPMSPC